MKKTGNYLTITFPFLLALALQILGAFWGVIIYGVVMGIQMSAQGTLDINNIQDIANGALNPQILLGISAAIGIVDIVVFSIWLKKQKKSGDILVKADKLDTKGIVLILILGVCIQISLSIILTVISNLRPDWFDGYGELIDSLGMGNTFISFLYVGLVAPIAEELIFRGVTFNKARKYMPFLAANFAQALLFGIYHMNLIQGLYAFAMGLSFGLIRRAYSLIGAILLHMTVNIAGMTLDYILPEQILNNHIAVSILFLLTGAAVTAILLYAGKQVKNIQEEEPVYHIMDSYDDN
ncbi:type II CAAX endopeptidase family protein [Anaerocolumna sp. AGMB13020]|uniref:CPBP family intramembrane glutamic endopeptidase n=1 Tax=Anaerocolumna sp. AGMB13020 TaxID=3081750 RepID=UPI002954D4D1|nr:type II CAAX endopeptidase family protein [Anaerocolumna sp. AGMB13020]WOO34669.1 type II CAAX endopeptidase family protein [Anaerocolumna sp. AGMB13020]